MPCTSTSPRSAPPWTLRCPSDAPHESGRPDRGSTLNLRSRSIATVLVDAENVRRSVWPNIERDALVELAEEWAERHGHQIVVVFEGELSADDWIAAHAGEHHPYWLVTSDRELRERAGAGAERVIGGGSFARELRQGGAASSW